MLGSDGQKKKVYEEQEDCAFLRDMEGCLRGIWKEMIESPGKGWTKVSVGEMFGQFKYPHLHGLLRRAEPVEFCRHHPIVPLVFATLPDLFA